MVFKRNTLSFKFFACTCNDGAFKLLGRGEVFRPHLTVGNLFLVCLMMQQHCPVGELGVVVCG